MVVTFLKTKLVLPSGLEVVESHEELGVAVVLLGQEVLLGGPSGEALPRRGGGAGRGGAGRGGARGRARARAGRRRAAGRLAGRQRRDVRQRPALQQSLCKTNNIQSMTSSLEAKVT